ncbi:unnamed protein product [Cunninghamella blakesleeana]
MINVTLILGYITIPVVIDHSVYNQISKYDNNQWKNGSSLSITQFVKNQPEHLPVLSKHTIKIRPTAEMAEVELFRLLASSLVSNNDNNNKNTQYQTKNYGVILLNSSISTPISTSPSNKSIGIISSVHQHDILILKIVDASFMFSKNTPSYNPLSFHSIPSVDLDSWSDYPMEILKCCQQYQETQNVEQIEKLTNQIYDIASLYGYWDLWRVLEGIFSRFNFNPKQFLNQ